MLANRPRAPSRPLPRVHSAEPNVRNPDLAVPYDYAAQFRLTGKHGNLVQDVINISPDGVFVAVAIGYGLEEDRAIEHPLGLTAISVTSVIPADITLSDLRPHVLLEGLRVNPERRDLLFDPTAATLRYSTQGIPGQLADGLFQRVKPPQEFAFLFTMLDSSTGRELQDEPIHNLASLGESSGERPFRPLAQPMTFLPRSTIRMQIVEQSHGVLGTLFIVLYGYLIPNAGACPESVVRELESPGTAPGSSPDRVVPFDYLARLELTGRPGNSVEEEIPINIEGGFVATYIGYGLEAPEQLAPIGSGTGTGFLKFDPAPIANILSVNLRDIITGATISGSILGSGNFGINPPAGTYALELPGAPAPVVVVVLEGLTTTVKADPSGHYTRAVVNLQSIPIHLLPPDAWVDGIRFQPSRIRLAFRDNGTLSDQFPVEFLGTLFERLNRPEAVSFRYTIFDGGRGRELQNRSIHNIAGLGTAIGKRPFKKLARPLALQPRSTLRVAIREHTGRGTLHFVLQGYKVLRASRTGGLRQ